MVELNRNDQYFDNLFDAAEYNWTYYCDNEWELLTCVLLDTQTPLERLKEVIKKLKQEGMLDYRRLSEYEYIPLLLKNAGYIWYNQKARYFGQKIEFDLKKATWEQMQTIKGIGPKLASLWMRIMHGDDSVPIIDTHVKKWMFNQGYEGPFTDYAKMSAFMIKKAKEMGMTQAKLDQMIVSEGIAKRRGLLRQK
jgi:thermostable 8-oxoguanine DNA glycosylase